MGQPTDPNGALQKRLNQSLPGGKSITGRPADDVSPDTHVVNPAPASLPLVDAVTGESTHHMKE